MRQATPTLGRIAIIAFVLFGSGWIASYFFNGKTAERGVSSQASYGTPNESRNPQNVNSNDARNRILEELQHIDPNPQIDWQLSMNDNHEVKSISSNSGGVLSKNVNSDEQATDLGKKLLQAFGAAGTLVLPMHKGQLETDNENRRKFSLQQYYSNGTTNFPIIGGKIVLHSQDGVVNTADTSIKLVETVDETQNFDPAKAKMAAMKDPYSHPESVVLDDQQPWVYLPKDSTEGQLVWKMTTVVTRPSHITTHILISAKDGAILKPRPSEILEN